MFGGPKKSGEASSNTLEAATQPKPLFGAEKKQAEQEQPNPFASAAPSGSGGLFGQKKPASSGGLFGTRKPSSGGGLFGKPPQDDGSLPGSSGPPPDFLLGDQPPPDLDAIEPSVFPAAEPEATTPPAPARRKLRREASAEEAASGPETPPVSGRRRLRREASSEEVRSCTTILCDQVPAIALKKPLLEKFFSRFGKVTKVLVNARKESATITFDSHEAAKMAKERGRHISPKLPPIGLINYLKPKKKESPKASSGSLFGAASAASGNEVERELQAMGGGVADTLFSAPRKARAGSSIFAKPEPAPKPAAAAAPAPAAAVARLPLKRRPVNREASPKPPAAEPEQPATGAAEAPKLNQGRGST